MKKICFIMDASPKFLGGTSIYVLNFIKYLEQINEDFKITCIYPGEENKKRKEKNIEWIEIKTKMIFPFNFFEYTKRVASLLKNKEFDIINSHAMAGNYLRYIKPSAFTTNTYHGVAHNFYKIHLNQCSLKKKLGAIYYIFFGTLLEKAPMKKADKIISVSNHVEKELIELYSLPNKKAVIRSSVDLTKFKKRSKEKTKKELGLDKNKKYLLYVGRGGFWRKGLDRAIKLSKELIKKDPTFELIVIGPSKTKENLRLIDELKDNINYIPVADRDLLSKYYSASEIFFCFSRYEGGAPILTLGEAMASNCLVVCSKDSNQEIIKDNINGIIIKKFEKNEAERIFRVLRDKKRLEKMNESAKKEIEKLSLDKWGEKYFEALLK
jgi:glycosyltransferase involved in cell wall biosynthesis